MKKILLFDFDGVICNSIDECFLISYNSFCNIEKSNLSPCNTLNKISLDQKNHFYSLSFSAHLQRCN